MNAARFIGHMGIRVAEDAEDNTRRIRGVASTKGKKRDGIVLDMDSLGRAAKMYDRRNGKMFWNHTWAVPIGSREKLNMVDGDLHFQGRIGRGFPVPVAVGPLGMPVLMQVDDLWEIMKQGLATSLSIAFNAEEIKEKDRAAKDSPTHRCTDLFEISVVCIPGDPDAEFAVTHAMDDDYYRQALEGSTTKREITRADLWDLRVDGAAAAAAVGLDDGVDLDTEADPFELLEGRDSELWERIREGLEECRRTLQQK